MTWIKSKIIMLPSVSINQVKEGDLFINDTRRHSWGKLEALKCERVTSHGHAWNGTGIKTEINHLYFVSDDEIKEGDWFLYSFKVDFTVTPQKCGGIDKSTGCYRIAGATNCYTPYKEGYKKIIATTDPKLISKKCTNCNGYGHTDKDGFDKCSLCSYGEIKLLSQPSQDFIKKYCEAGGIDEVEIEYKMYATEPHNFIDYKIIINPDNTINIHMIKDSYSREEVVRLCESAWHKGSNWRLGECNEDRFDDPNNEQTLSDWIKENLLN